MLGAGLVTSHIAPAPVRRSRRHERPKSVGSGTVPSDAPAAYGANATGPGRWTVGEVSVGSKAKTRHAVALASACEHRAPRHRGYDHAQAQQQLNIFIKSHDLELVINLSYP